MTLVDSPFWVKAPSMSLIVRIVIAVGLLDYGDMLATLESETRDYFLSRLSLMCPAVMGLALAYNCKSLATIANQATVLFAQHMYLATIETIQI